jgi:ADP-heptose:LPS heptosyltransferase
MPPDEETARMHELLHGSKVPPNFITFNPLYDAPYNSFRNATPGWWKSLAIHLAKKVPVVMIGTKANSEKIKDLGNNIYPLWEHNLSVIESLALIHMGQCHIGGECGPTLWAPVLRKPTIGIYDGFSPWPNWWTRPMIFDGKTPIKIVKLGGRSDAIAESIIDFLKTEVKTLDSRS